ncbi:hypothetical protein BH23ACT9_BH23ACT9_37210 [soil metagenome]
MTAAGGTEVGRTAGAVNVGEIPLGAGTVRTIGTLLPPPVDSPNAPLGLNSYGVLDTGYQILLNTLDADLTIHRTTR